MVSVDGRQGIEQEKLLTVCVERKSYEQAKAFFATFEATLKQNFGDSSSIRQYFNNDDVYNSFINALGGEKKAISLGIRLVLLCITNSV